MSYKPRIKTVPEGGTDKSSTTAYAVQCGGTSSTSAFQDIASVGTSGQVLTSNGAGAKPSMQAITSTGLIVWWAGSSGTPTDSGTFYFANVFSSSGSAGPGSADFASTRFYVPQNGTIKAAYGAFTLTTGTSESVTLRIIVNNSTNVDISTSINMSASPVNVSNASLSQAVSAGDYLQLVYITPAWVTNPTAVKFSGSIYIVNS